MSLELSITIGLTLIVVFFVFLGEKLLKNNKFIMRIIGWNCYSTALFFLTILLFLLMSFSDGQAYEGVVRVVFIIFQILFGLAALPGFIVTGVLAVLNGYAALFKGGEK